MDSRDLVFLMRMLVLAIAILMGAVGHASAQEYLVPELGSLNDHPATLVYAQKLRAAMFAGSPYHYRARIICEPAFQARWAVTLVCYKGERPDYFVEYVILLKDMKDGEFQAQKARVALDRQAAEVVQEVWLRMLRAVRYPENARDARMGADGVTYHFSRFASLGGDDPRAPAGYETGQTWTPDSSSATGRLASIGEAMRDFATAPEDKRAALRDRVLRLAIGLQTYLDQKAGKGTDKSRKGEPEAGGGGKGDGAAEKGT